MEGLGGKLAVYMGLVFAPHEIYGDGYCGNNIKRHVKY
jgi:hypothetical protein